MKHTHISTHKNTLLGILPTRSPNQIINSTWSKVVSKALHTSMLEHATEHFASLTGPLPVLKEHTPSLTGWTWRVCTTKFLESIKYPFNLCIKKVILCSCKNFDSGKSTRLTGLSLKGGKCTNTNKDRACAYVSICRTFSVSVCARLHAVRNRSNRRFQGPLIEITVITTPSPRHLPWCFISTFKLCTKCNNLVVNFSRVCGKRVEEVERYQPSSCTGSVDLWVRGFTKIFPFGLLGHRSNSDLSLCQLWVCSLPQPLHPISKTKHFLS